MGFNDEKVNLEFIYRSRMFPDASQMFVWVFRNPVDRNNPSMDGYVLDLKSAEITTHIQSGLKSTAPVFNKRGEPVWSSRLLDDGRLREYVVFADSAFQVHNKILVPDNEEVFDLLCYGNDLIVLTVDADRANKLYNLDVQKEEWKILRGDNALLRIFPVGESIWISSELEPEPFTVEDVFTGNKIYTSDPASVESLLNITPNGRLLIFRHTKQFHRYAAGELRSNSQPAAPRTPMKRSPEMAEVIAYDTTGQLIWQSPYRSFDDGHLTDTSLALVEDKNGKYMLNAGPIGQLNQVAESEYPLTIVGQSDYGWVCIEYGERVLLCSQGETRVLFEVRLI